MNTHTAVNYYFIFFLWLFRNTFDRHEDGIKTLENPLRLFASSGATISAPFDARGRP